MSDLEMKDTLSGEETGVLRRPGKPPVRWTPKPVIETTVRALAGQFTGPAGKDGKDGAPGKDGANATNAQVSSAVLTYLTANPPAPGKDGAPGVPGTPKRVERYQGTVSGTQGIATVTFPAFSKPPLGKVIDGWNGDQQITGMVTATTTTTATVVVKRSRGTLLLTTGPYETAPAGSVVMIELIGE